MTRMTFQASKKVLLIGSGLSAREYDKSDYRNRGWAIVTINHAWEIEPDCDMWVHATDYKSAGGKMPEHDIIELDEYGVTLNNFGGHAACGYSITLCAAYNALWLMKPRVVAFLGCDMNYTPDENGNTHIYGVGLDIKKDGVPDPDKMVAKYKDRDPDYLRNIYMRFSDEAKKLNCWVFNVSSDKDTRLPYSQVTPLYAGAFDDKDVE